jgi:hypothetical protein
MRSRRLVHRASRAAHLVSRRPRGRRHERDIGLLRSELREPECGDKRRCSPCASSTHRAPPSGVPVRCEGDLRGDLNTVGRVTGALLRLLEDKTTLPPPFP